MSIITIGLLTYIFYLIMGYDTANFLSTLYKVELPATIKFYSICILVVSAFFFYNIWREAVNREQRLCEENLKYSYRTLKTQVNPHFLFNSLNTLSEMVYESPEKADRCIQNLAGIYRYILDNEETDLIFLNKEIEFVKQYFELQEERNGNKVKLEIEVNNVDNLKLIPISLQLLVENALKHNSFSEERPLNICIYIEDGYVSVCNNIQRKNTLSEPSGKGLSNLKERIKLITGREMIVKQENKQFIVKIPVINLKDESINYRG